MDSAGQAGSLAGQRLLTAAEESVRSEQDSGLTPARSSPPPACTLHRPRTLHRPVRSTFKPAPGNYSSARGVLLQGSQCIPSEGRTRDKKTGLYDTPVILLRSEAVSSSRWPNSDARPCDFYFSTSQSAVSEQLAV